MDILLTQFAAAEADAKGGDLFLSIGVDWRLLLLQTVAFLILLWFLKKFVYPSLVAMLDKHEGKLAEAAAAAQSAEKKAAASKVETEKLLREARKEAAAIVATAKQESADLSHNSDKKAKERAERIVEDARAQVAKDVETARRQLHNDMLDLVAEATEKVTSHVIDANTDKQLIAKNLKEAK